MPARGYSSSAPRKTKRKYRRASPASRGPGTVAAQRASSRTTQRQQPRSAASRGPGTVAAQRASSRQTRRQKPRSAASRGPGTVSAQRASSRATREQLPRLTQREAKSLLDRLSGTARDTFEFLYPAGTKTTGNSQRPTSLGVATPAFQPRALAVRVPSNMVRAFAGDPTGVAAGTAKSGKDAILGVPAALLSAITDPKGEAKSIIKDYKRRYGSQTDEQMIKRMQKEGILGEVLDATLLAAGPGSVVGKGLGTAAKKGKLGRSAQKTVTEPRRNVRISGGVSRPQDLSPSLFKAARQKGRDETIYRGQQRAAKRGPIRAEVREALTRGEVVPSRVTGALRVNRSGVAPLLEISRTPSSGKLERAQRKDFAQSKGRTLHAMRREQRTEVGGAKRNLAGLNRHERAAFKTALQLGATTPKAARAVVARRIALIERTREETGDAVRGADELPLLYGMVEAPDTYFTKGLRAVVTLERERGERVALGDPGIAPMQALMRVTNPQAEAMGIRRGDMDDVKIKRRASSDDLGVTLRRDRGETPQQYVARVDRAARDIVRTTNVAAERGPDGRPDVHFVQRAADDAPGLDRPGFFPSRKREKIGFSQFAAGGTKAIGRDKAYKGVLFRSGREDASDTTYLQGVAQNVKRKHNWNLVADAFDRHTLPEARDKTISQLEDFLEANNIDPSTVAFWNPARYREAREEWDKNETPDEERAAGEEPVAAGVGEAVRQATVDARGLATMPEDFRTTKGWSLVPKGLHDEIHTDTRPSGKFARSLDVVKGKQARIMLGLSPAWLQFQVASNGLLTGLAGTGPVDLLRANLQWWRTLDDDQKAAVEPYVGLGPFSDSYEQTRLGASANGKLINSYRAFKNHDFWHKPRKTASGKSYRDLNPLDILFRIDNAQNNFFRRGVLYSQVKRDAYRRMGGRMKHVMRSEDKIMSRITQDPAAAMRDVMNDPQALEKHARHVNDFLGDYMTYTAKERRLIQRNVMFYGFLRHSLHLVFYTLPARHPLIAATMAQLGKMTTEEVRRLLGGNELPYALGRFYRVQDGKVKSIDVQRMNPALNTLTSLQGPNSLAGLAPPLFTAIADQIYSASSFLDRRWKVKGETQPRAKGRDYALYDERVRIFVEQMATLATPYRDIKASTAKGPEGEDTSLLLGRRPTEFKDPEIKANIKKTEEERPDAFATRMLLRMFPLVPREDRSVEIAHEMRERNKRKKGKGSGPAGTVQQDIKRTLQGGSGLQGDIDAILGGGVR